MNIKKLSKKEIEQLKLQKEKELNSLEFERNEEYLLELEKIKLNPLIINFDAENIQPIEEKGEVPARYPSGYDGFRREIAEKFCAGTIEAKGKMSTEIMFVIEKDGSIIDVKATGVNDDFNRQAQLAVYLTEKQWRPATINGYPVRYRVKIPLYLNFD